MKLSTLNVYAPTDITKSESTKPAFYSALNKAKEKLDENPSYKIVVLLDFNATISSKSKESGSWDSILGHNSDKVETNDNGECMLKWCLKNLKITNSLFRSKRIHWEIWRHAAMGNWKRVDYICTSNRVYKMVKSCRVYIGPSGQFDSDDRMLAMDVTFPAMKCRKLN